MIHAADFLRPARNLGFSLFTGVPCSYLKPLINYAIDSPDLDYVGAANEGDAVAIASGAQLSGRRGVAMFQNSGLGNAVNPLTSLNAIFRIPLLVIVTWRGEPCGSPDEPQHELMGQITAELFETMRLPYDFFPETEDEIEPLLRRAAKEMDRNRLPFGLIMKNDAVAPYSLKTKLRPKPFGAVSIGSPRWGEMPTRTDVLRCVQSGTRYTDAVIATTGYMSRTLYGLEDRPNQLYMVGSMGCVSSVGLGLALSQPDRRVIVLDGDGSALMRLGAMPTVGYERPSNLIHIVLDNEMHESTGGQSTATHSIDLAAIAEACGYPRVLKASCLEEIESVMTETTEELTFVHMKIRPRESDNLPRLALKPNEVAARFRAWLQETCLVGAGRY
jgi:phosphonopyruvate decarboxylase